MMFILVTDDVMIVKSAWQLKTKAERRVDVQLTDDINQACYFESIPQAKQFQAEYHIKAKIFSVKKL